MDYLQYYKVLQLHPKHLLRFKPYYKWITFNIERCKNSVKEHAESFKPYYKWITFNIVLLEAVKKYVA